MEAPWISRSTDRRWQDDFLNPPPNPDNTPGDRRAFRRERV